MEGNVLFNDALNIFYFTVLWATLGLPFLISSKESFYAPSYRQDSIYRGMFHQSWSTVYNVKHFRRCKPVIQLICDDIISVCKFSSVTLLNDTYVYVLETTNFLSFLS